MQLTVYHTFFKTQSRHINLVVSKTCHQRPLNIQLLHLFWRNSPGYLLPSKMAIICAFVHLSSLARIIYSGKSNS